MRPPRPLSLIVLSRGAVVHSTRRLVEAAQRLGHECRVVDPLALQLKLDGGRATLHEGRRRLAVPDVVIPRFAQSVNHYGSAVVTQFELAGATVLNGGGAIDLARNKIRLMQRLVSAGLPVPATLVGRGAQELRRMVDDVGGFPVAVKVVGGPEHSGVLVCETAGSMEAPLEAVASLGHTLVVQRHVTKRGGRDLRLFVVGGEVLAAVRRHVVGGRLRRTLGPGRRVTRIRPGAALRDLARAAVAATGLTAGAVDLLEERGAAPVVFDVHASPGLGELEEATGEDLAGPVVAHAVLRRLGSVRARKEGSR